MNARFLSLLFCWVAALGLSLSTARAQGFAGLGTQSEGFAMPSPDRALQFPADHAAHPDYRIEWWYLTATLTGPDGTPYGVQWTLFRSALRPPEDQSAVEAWADHTIWMGHAAVTTPDDHFLAERFARDGIGQAGVSTAPFSAFIDEWAMTSVDADIQTLSLTAQGRYFAYDLSLSAKGPLVLHGDGGYSVKSASGQASYYYSQPFYTVSGTLTLPSGPVPVSGSAWLDREWSSQPLDADQSGWDWVSLHLDTGAKLMAARVRDSGAGFTFATFITPDGTPIAYENGALTLTPLHYSDVAGRSVPTTWRITLPAQDIDTTLTALNPEAWMDTAFPYWEGPAALSGSHGGTAYLEMTGY